MKPAELLKAFELIERERNIPRDIIIQGIKDAISRAYQRDVDPEAVLDIFIDENTGDIKVFKTVTVVNKADLEDELTEIDLEEAKRLDPSLKLGDTAKKPLPIEAFSRSAVHHIKQVIIQKSSEAQKDQVFEEWGGKIDTVINGEVERVDPESHSVVVNLGKTQGFVPPLGTIKGETLVPGKRYDFYIQDVRKTARTFPIVLSRTAPGFVAYLLKNECPEIQEGTVEIKAVARDPGIRCKLAVWSNNPHIDPIGACVGRKGLRINTISQQINGEKIDVILWDEDPLRFIVNAMSPAQVAGVAVVENTETYRDATVVVPDDQLSLAIGRKGSTARLATQLTGWNLDIKSMSQAKEEEIEYELNGNMHEPRKARSPFPGAGGFNRSEGAQAAFRAPSRSPRQFDIGTAFDDQTMDEYEQTYTKKTPKDADSPEESAAAQPKERAEPKEKPAPAKDESKDDATDDIDNMDLDDLYDRK